MKLFYAMVIFIESFLFLCLNVFTIPLMLVLWLICKLLRLTPPHFANYSLTLYPTWSYLPHRGMVDDMKEIKRKSDAKTKRHRPIHAWEERFFGWWI